MDSASLIDLLQWPAMLASILAAWLVASTRAQRRNLGFWVFIASNVLWTAWGLHTRAYALIVPSAVPSAVISPDEVQPITVRPSLQALIASAKASSG